MVEKAIFLLAALIAIAVITACAARTPPYCDKPQAQAVQSGDGTFLIFDAANSEKLRQMILGIEAGTCRLNKGEA